MTGDTLAVIDLGEDFGPQVETAPQGARRRRHDRRWQVIALAIAVLVLLGGGSAVTSTPLVQVAHVPAAVADSYQLFDDGLYVWDDREPRTLTYLTRYDLSGHPLWSRMVAGNGPETYVLETDNETIVDANLVDGVSHVMGLDRRTGALLWDQTATYGNGYPFIQMVDPRGRLLVYEAGNHTSRLRWIDSRSGGTIWKVDLPNGWSPDFESDPAPGQRLWLVNLGGEVMGVTLDDHGAVIRHTLSGLGGVDTLDYRTITVGHGLVLVTDINGVFPEEQYATVHAYNEQTLAHLWDDSPGTNASATFCSTEICETSNVGLSVVDPATGSHLWSTVSGVIYPSGRNLIVGPFSPTGRGRQSIVQAGNGHIVVDLNSWSFVPVRDSSLLLLQPTTGFVGVWLARLSPGEIRPRILGAVPDMSTMCVATARDIACHAIDGTIVVWRTS